MLVVETIAEIRRDYFVDGKRITIEESESLVRGLRCRSVSGGGQIACLE